MKKLVQMLFGWIPGVKPATTIPHALDANVIENLPPMKKVVIYQTYSDSYMKEDIAKKQGLPSVIWCHNLYDLMTELQGIHEPTVIVMGLVHSRENQKMTDVLYKLATIEGLFLFWYSMNDYKEDIEQDQRCYFDGVIKKGGSGDELIPFLQAISK